MNPSMPDAVACTHRSDLAAAKSVGGMNPRTTSQLGAVSNAAPTPSTTVTVAPGPAASRMRATAASLTSGNVRPFITSTFTAPAFTPPAARDEYWGDALLLV